MKNTQTLVAAYGQTYAIAIVILVAAAFLVRRYAPRNQDICVHPVSGSHARYSCEHRRVLASHCRGTRSRGCLCLETAVTEAA
jgi:hypothetical protein